MFMNLDLISRYLDSIGYKIDTQSCYAQHWFSKTEMSPNIFHIVSCVLNILLSMNAITFKLYNANSITL